MPWDESPPPGTAIVWESAFDNMDSLHFLHFFPMLIQESFLEISSIMYYLLICVHVCACMRLSLNILHCLDTSSR